MPEETAKASPTRRAARKARLREDVRCRSEDRPGVYRMTGEEGEFLYVGKSVRVRSRLLSYFRAAPGDKAAELMRATRSIEWEYVPNEFAALVRELRLIKEWLPKFNVEHTRRPRYAFLKLTSGPAPRLLATDRVSNDGATYFGPFPRPARLLETVRDLTHIAGIRDCSASVPIHFGDQLEIFGQGRPPRCLRADTGSCLAPCAGRCTDEEYRTQVQELRRFLEGRGRGLARRIESRMTEAARRQDFEYAALLRDRVERLSAFQDTLVAFRGRIANLTFVYRVPGYRGDDRLYLLRRGLVLDSLPYPKGRKANRAVTARIRCAFGSPGIDPTLVSSKEAAEMLLVARWFRRNPREEGRTWKPEEWLEERGVD